MKRHSKLKNMLESLQAREIKLKKTQSQLVQAGKLTALGQLSAGVAHEINQPLTSIVIWAGLAKDAMDTKGTKSSDQKIKESLGNIEENVNRIKKIVTRLRDFSRHSESRFDEININTVVDNSLVMFGEQLKIHDIKLRLDCDPNLPPYLWGCKPTRADYCQFNYKFN